MAKRESAPIGTAQAAKRLGISQRRVLALIESGRLPATQVGRTWIIDPAALELVRDRRPGRPPTKP